MNEEHSFKKNEKKKWTIRESKVNLAALLNDPRKVRRDYDLFTKTWGETFRELPPGTIGIHGYSMIYYFPCSMFSSELFNFLYQFLVLIIFSHPCLFS